MPDLPQTIMIHSPRECNQTQIHDAGAAGVLREARKFDNNHDGSPVSCCGATAMPASRKPPPGLSVPCATNTMGIPIITQQLPGCKLLTLTLTPDNRNDDVLLSWTRG